MTERHGSSTSAMSRVRQIEQASLRFDPDDEFVIYEQCYLSFDAFMPRIAPEAHVLLQVEIDRLDRIGHIMLKAYDVVSQLELVLHAGELFENLGVSLDEVLEEINPDTERPNPS